MATFHTGGHSSRVRTMVRGAQWQALRPLLRRAKGLVAVCHFEVEVFARRLGLEPERIRLIRNGAEPLPVGDSVPEVSGSPLVCSVARLERYKGHHRLIAAMPALLDLAPDAHLAVIGRGSFEQQLRRLVARLQVEHAVTFTSFDATQREALGALLRSSDVVALMSDYEANPVAVMEALALGRKVVVADTSGLSELASEGLATAVPPNASPGVLAGVLARVAAQSAIRWPPTCRPGTTVQTSSSNSTTRSFLPALTAEATLARWGDGPRSQRIVGLLSLAAFPIRSVPTRSNGSWPAPDHLERPLQCRRLSVERVRLRVDERQGVRREGRFRTLLMPSSLHRCRRVTGCRRS